MSPTIQRALIACAGVIAVSLLYLAFVTWQFQARQAESEKQMEETLCRIAVKEATLFFRGQIAILPNMRETIETVTRLQLRDGCGPKATLAQYPEITAGSR